MVDEFGVQKVETAGGYLGSRCMVSWLSLYGVLTHMAGEAIYPASIGLDDLD